VSLRYCLPRVSRTIPIIRVIEEIPSKGDALPDHIAKLAGVTFTSSLARAGPALSNPALHYGCLLMVDANLSVTALWYFGGSPKTC